MESKELILHLVQMLQNNGTNSSVSKLPSIDIKKLGTPSIVDQDVLLSFLNFRLECACIDTRKAHGYLLIPYSKNQWKVFVFDNKKEPYAPLDDYNDIVYVNSGDVSSEQKEPFVVNRPEGK